MCTAAEPVLGSTVNVFCLLATEGLDAAFKHMM
jgi:hypothetical protein